MTDRELMQDALDVIIAAIKSGDWKVDGACDPDFVINALRARLSQPEPAECDGGQCGIGGYCKQCPKTQPEREWVGLTDEDRREIISGTERDDRGYVMALVEAKLREKNG